MEIRSLQFGAFSLKNVHALENKLCEIEVEMREKITFLIKKFENIENYKECLKMWKDEAEVKIRKTMHKPLLFEDATEMCELKLPHSQNSLSQQLTVLKFDPDLNNPHPTCLPDPSPNNSTTQDSNGHVKIQMETSKESCAEEDTMYSMTMVEVSGPQGSTLVFHPWISSEISAASQHLPNPTASGQILLKNLSLLSRFQTYYERTKESIDPENETY
ncbi:hypothetical protein NQD34_018180 [Periophthalmus magnuspinnatus]|nr:hypothetical protein NQD34_018180 [Periophthalmus magnuspinnatus]